MDDGWSRLKKRDGGETLVSTTMPAPRSLGKEDKGVMY